MERKHEVAARREVIKAAINAGITQLEISKAFGISRQAINLHSSKAIYYSFLDEKLEAAVALRQAGWSDNKIAKALQIARNTLLKYLGATSNPRTVSIAVGDGSQKERVSARELIYHLYSPDKYHYYVFNFQQLKVFCKSKGFDSRYLSNVLARTKKVRGELVTTAYQGWHGHVEWIGVRKSDK